jgi:hypothetical protein
MMAPRRERRRERLRRERRGGQRRAQQIGHGAEEEQRRVAGAINGSKKRLWNARKRVGVSACTVGLVKKIRDFSAKRSDTF